MTVLKILYHIQAAVKLLVYKVLYLDKLILRKGITFRKGFSVIIFEKGKVFIGADCFFNNYCTLASIQSIIIGEGTLFGENVKVYDHNHIYIDKNIPIKKQGYKSAPIVIGKHCWIGSNVVILKGVEIGDNSVIGAGCVIYKSVPPNSIVVNKQELVIKEW